MLIFIVYLQVLHFGFVNIDDSIYVTRNTYVLNGLSFSGIIWSFTSTYAGFWHPITWLSLMTDTQLFGTWIGGYHLTNLLLHVASSLSLFFIFDKMTGSFWKSIFVAALFALHPLHVESVAWIAERKDVLSAFWGMLTIYTYVCYVENPGIKRYALVLILFFLGLMSKPMLVTLPFALLLLDYWPLCRISFRVKGCNIENSQDENFIALKPISIGRLILEKVPLFILIIPMSIVTFFAEQQLGALPSIKSFPLDMRVYNAIISYGRYIEKTIFPLNLSVYYPHPGLWPLWQVILTGSIIALISLLVIRKLDRYPYLAVGWLWYLGTLVPVIGLIQIGSQAMADRYSYIPLIGLFIMFAWGVPDLFHRLPGKKTILSTGAILLIIIISFLSWQRCQLWGDNFALWNDVLKKYKIAFAYSCRGEGYAEKGNYQQAINDYNAALAIKLDAEFYSNRANAYAAIKQYERAFSDYDHAVRIKPNFADGFYNRGLLYNNLGKYDLAILDFSSAIRFDPAMADAYLSRGIALGSQNKYNKALADFNQALKINHNLFQAYYNRGIVYNIYKKYDLAIDDFKTALKIQPGHVATTQNLQAAIQMKEGLENIK